MKQVLITGENSYIGNAIAAYLQEYRTNDQETSLPAYQVTKISLRDDGWEAQDFSAYDVVLHVAGKAHVDVSAASQEEQESYYRVNAGLVKKVAEKAKQQGVKQFVHFSSVIVYGDSAKVGQTKHITQDTIPAPSNFYGDSKLKGEEELAPLADETFQVAILRLPFVYGKGCKGNYPLLVKLAEKLPVFPDIGNERSMLYIENLTEFVRQIIDKGQGGLFFPQNGEYVTTARMVAQIGQAKGKKVRLVKWLCPLVVLAGKMPGKIGKLADKAFGSLTIDRSLSDLGDNSYRKYSLEESIRRIHED